jgi:hypothetical protein
MRFDSYLFQPICIIQNECNIWCRLTENGECVTKVEKAAEGTICGDGFDHVGNRYYISETIAEIYFYFLL